MTIRVGLIAGFLGSGKTSTIMEVGRMLSEGLGKKVAILVNELGEIGIDGDYLESLGMEAKTVTGGCICCSLGTDMLATIKLLEEIFSPEVILIEPTGVAVPSTIKQFLGNFSLGTSLEIAPTIVLVDGYQFVELLEELGEFVERQAKDGEIITINKTDLIKTEHDLEQVKEAIKRLNPHAHIMEMSAKNAEGIGEIIDVILGINSSIRDSESNNPINREEDFESGGEGESDSKRLAEVGWGGVKIDFSEAGKVSNFENIFGEMLKKIGEEVIKQGSILIGHIKASISAADNVMKASLLDLELGVDFSGKLPERVDEGEISLLAVVHGLEDKTVQEIVEKAAKEVLNTHAIKFQIEVHKHEDHE